ncbi:MAG: hypothetical protein WDN02_05165 [Methylovirgula sp.]|uniref:hypothetical protein n=1 Tax=Methylovirgula sp. TaxID=1978224 RepID=UPI0030761C9C
MSDIYKIAVQLQMVSNAPAFLAMLSRQVLGVHTKIKDLEGGFNRLHAALGGGIAIAAGAAFVGVLKAATDQASELNHQLASVATLSANPMQSVALRTRALNAGEATARNVNGTRISDNVKIFGESYSLLGEAGASAVNQPLAKLGVVLGAIEDPDRAQEQIYNMLRSGDLAGKIQDPKTHKVDPQRLLTYLGLASRIARCHGREGRA